MCFAAIRRATLRISQQLPMHLTNGTVSPPARCSPGPLLPRPVAPPVRLGESRTNPTADKMLLIGYPYQHSPVPTDGAISRKRISILTSASVSASKCQANPSKKSPFRQPHQLVVGMDTRTRMPDRHWAPSFYRHDRRTNRPCPVSLRTVRRPSRTTRIGHKTQSQKSPKGPWHPRVPRPRYVSQGCRSAAQ